MMIPFLSLKDVTSRYGFEIHEAVSRVVDSGWYLQGSEVADFERDYAAYIGTKHAVGCANGLDALSIILRAYRELGIMRPGDEVVVPIHTYIASILAITENDLVPVFVEPNQFTYVIDDSQIESAITPRTRALMIVHLYGQCAYTPRIAQICQQYDLKLIEDNAQAHGCMCDGKRTGSLGDAAGHSFYPGKNLGALGDAGAVTTDDDEVADAVRAIANYGSTKKYVFRYQGRNSRLDEINAAVLGVKLQHLDEDNERRRRVARRYISQIDNPAVLLPTVADWNAHVFHIFAIRTMARDDLQQYLAARGIETLIHYPIPPHKQECYKAWNQLSYPITERIHREELSLPMSPTLGDHEVGEIIEAVNSFKHPQRG